MLRRAGRRVCGAVGGGGAPVVGREVAFGRALNSSIALLPLNKPIPDIPSLRPKESLAEPRTEVTVLSNGLRVASEETYGSVSSLGLFVDAGTMHEPEGKFGLGNLLENLAFSGTERWSGSALSSHCGRLGMQPSATVLRDSFVLKADVLRGDVGEGVELLAEAALRPRFTAEGVEEARRVTVLQAMGLEESAEDLIQELICEAAYGPESALGHRLRRDSAQNVTLEDVEAFVRDRFHPGGMCLSAAGVEHGTLVELAERHFGHIPPKPSSPPPPRSRKEAMALFDPSSDRQWRGGFVQVPFSSPPGTGVREVEHAHVSFGLYTPGWVHRDVVAITVLDTLLGGGASFSAGGPGKGIYSRIYREVLARFPWVSSCNAYSIQFRNEGFWGMYASAPTPKLLQLIDTMLFHLVRLANEAPEEEELQRAKNQLLSSVMMNLEYRAVLCEDTGRQVLGMGERIEAEELRHRINAVTADGIVRIVRESLAQPCAMAVMNGADMTKAHEFIAVALQKVASEAALDQKTTE